MSQQIDTTTKTIKNGQNKKSTTKKLKKTIEVLHPVFSTLADLSRDNYWKEMYTNMSIGKFPKKFSYREGKLIYQVKSNVKKINLSSNVEELEENHFAITKFLQDNGSLMSEVDKRRESDMLLVSIANSCTDYTESSIFKNKRLFNLLLIEYANKMCPKEPLKTEFFNKLNLASTLGMITQTDVVFGRDDDRIIIDDIKFIQINDEGEVYYTKSIPIIPFKPVEKIQAQVFRPFDMSWSKFLKWTRKQKKEERSIVESSDTQSVISEMPY